MTFDRWWVDGLGGTRARRDPRENDPDYYRDWCGRWVKRTEWTVENYPAEADRETYMRFLQETNPAERETLLSGYMATKGLIRWHRCWITPERAEELESRYQEGLARARRETERTRAARARFPSWLWC